MKSILAFVYCDVYVFEFPSKRGMLSIVMEYVCAVTISLTMNSWRILSWMSGSWCKKKCSSIIVHCGVVMVKGCQIGFCVLIRNS